MKKIHDDNALVRYGITPAAFVEFGWILLFVSAAAASGVVRLVVWLLQ